MAGASFLPTGYELEEVEDKIVDCPIIQADDLGPTFTVKVRLMPVKEYRKVFEKLNQQSNTGGFRKSNTLNDKVDKDYLKRAVVDWSGLSCDNWNAICRDGRVLKGPKGGTIEHSEEACFHLYRNTFPSDFGDKVWEILKNGAEEQEEEESQLKKA